MPLPFDGCSPAPSAEHATWITDALRAREGVAFVVPDRFDRCVRVHHVLPDQRRWADVAPQYLARTTERYEYPFPDSVAAAAGHLGDAIVDRLVEHLSRQSGGDVPCHYGLWKGWGDLHAGSSTVAYAQKRRWPWDWALSRLRTRRAQRARVARARPAYDLLDACPTIKWWGGRDMWLFDGCLSAVRAIGAVSPWCEDQIHRRSPQWWWPSNRTWFVANEIDHPWTYAAGPATLVEAILADDALETVDVEFNDSW